MAPFVGTFLARISRGRTIGNVVAYALKVPGAFALVWFSTFGAAALRMDRRAKFLEKMGKDDSNNADYFLYTGDLNDGKCYDVPTRGTCPGSARRRTPT